MQDLLNINTKYGIRCKLISQFGNEWMRHIPKGYRTFSPLMGHFIISAHTLTENVMGAALGERRLC
ncbi:MAG: hypothetical protein IJP54_02955, partial [Synergistaceae bacterium]|nr:hypothetical protein [Synergistaceae bacterium]